MKILINRAQVEAKVMKAWDKGLPVLSEEILADCNQYVKRDQTPLMMSSMIHSRPKDGILVWETPYARRQYWEIQTALTPGTTWKWCETAKRKHLREWKEQAERGLLANL